MKEIILVSILSGPHGTLNPGKHFVEDKLAADLVEGGYASYRTVTTPEKATGKTGEKAVVVPAEIAVVTPEEAAKEPEQPKVEVPTNVVPSPWPTK